MDLIQLDCLATVARLGTVTAAASYLRISQPAVTKRIQALEDELGVALFVRNGKHLTLSRSGQQLLPRAEYILSACVEFKRAAAATRSLRTVRLSVRAASSLLPRLMMMLGQKYPGMDVQVVQEQDRHADLTIDATLDEHWPTGTRLLLKEQVVLAVPIAHPLAVLNEVGPEDLRPYPLISLCRGRAMRDIEDTLCRRGGFVPHRSVECDTPATLRSLVAQGMGVAFAASRSWFVEPTEQVRLLPLAPCHQRYVTLTPAPQLLDDPAVLKLCEDIEAFFRTLIPE